MADLPLSCLHSSKFHPAFPKASSIIKQLDMTSVPCKVGVCVKERGRKHEKERQFVSNVLALTRITLSISVLWEV